MQTDPDQVGGVDERRARRVDLRHKGVLDAAVLGRIQHRAGRRAVGGEISRDRAARHIGRAFGIHRDVDAHVLAAPAQVGGVHERRARGAELGHEGVGETAQSPIQHRAGGGAAGGEISRARDARHIGRARGIHRDAEACG